MDWFVARVEAKEESSTPLLNDAHDRADERQIKSDVSEARTIAALRIEIEERFSTLNATTRILSERLSNLEERLDERTSSPAPSYSPVSRFEGRMRQEDDRGRSPDRPARDTQLNRPIRPQTNEQTVESFERALIRALAEQSTAGLEVDSLLKEIRIELGDLAIQTQYVGQSAGGRWQIAVLWLPPPSAEGFALVSPGGLADSDVVKFFDVDYGRRVFGCRKPARVARDGDEITVARRGSVESSG
jgi:hypothetical protein